MKYFSLVTGVLPLSLLLCSCDMAGKINRSTHEIEKNTWTIERSTDAIERNLEQLKKAEAS